MLTHISLVGVPVAGAAATGLIGWIKNMWGSARTAPDIANALGENMPRMRLGEIPDYTGSSSYDYSDLSGDFSDFMEPLGNEPGGLEIGTDFSDSDFYDEPISSDEIIERWLDQVDDPAPGEGGSGSPDASPPGEGSSNPNKGSSNSNEGSSNSNEGNSNSNKNSHDDSSQGENPDQGQPQDEGPTVDDFQDDSFGEESSSESLQSEMQDLWTGITTQWPTTATVVTLQPEFSTDSTGIWSRLKLQ
jgi:hypothetical protein